MGMKFCELASKAIKNGDEDEMWSLADDFVEAVASSNPKLYKEFMCDLEKIAYRIPLDEAEKIVGNMRPKGQYWSAQQIKKLLAEKGVDTKEFVEYYLVMNMCYNDYYETAKLFGLDRDPEFYFSLAKDFIDDPDAKPFKVQKYFLD